MSKTPANFTPPILETARTIMRGPQLHDFEASAEMWSDPQVVEFITGIPQTPEQSWKRLIHKIGHWHALGYGNWTVEDKQTGEFLGQVGLGNSKRGIDSELDPLPEIGWVFASKSHGRGLATETINAAIEWADKNIAASKTFCIFSPEHSVSQRVASKCGYHKSTVATYQGESVLIMTRNRPDQTESQPT